MELQGVRQRRLARDVHLVALQDQRASKPAVLLAGTGVDEAAAEPGAKGDGVLPDAVGALAVDEVVRLAARRVLPDLLDAAAGERPVLPEGQLERQLDVGLARHLKGEVVAGLGRGDGHLGLEAARAGRAVREVERRVEAAVGDGPAERVLAVLVAALGRHGQVVRHLHLAAEAHDPDAVLGVGVVGVVGAVVGVVVAVVAIDGDAVGAKVAHGEEVGHEPHGLEDGLAVPRAEHGRVRRQARAEAVVQVRLVAGAVPVGAAKDGHGQLAAPGADEAGGGVVLFKVDKGGLLGPGQRGHERRPLDEGAEVVAEVGAALALDEAGHGGEAGVAVEEGHLAEDGVELAHVVARVLGLVLAAAEDGLDLAAGLGVLDGQLEVLADGGQQAGAAELVGDGQQRRVRHGGVVDGAALRVDAVGVHVDALGEPLVDAGDQAAVLVTRDARDARQGAADLPAVVRRVDAALGEARACLDEDGADGLGHGPGGLVVVRLEDAHHDAKVLDQEPRVRRRVPVADGVGAVVVLAPGEDGEHLVNVRQQGLVVVEGRVGPHKGRDEAANLARETARRARQRRVLVGEHGRNLAIGGPCQELEAGRVDRGVLPGHDCGGGRRRGGEQGHPQCLDEATGNHGGDGVKTLKRWERRERPRDELCKRIAARQES
ncbi:hypothetical protein CTA1_1316 [Colletotrichum tanaceti]|uniref:Uncharacterized protein n=1 Tax=Colletotrichum tanaceti TaxID=1306861 RepID=A0A4U6X1Z2_9PEZI|nr:hypothetical protein CTA1_1316 [Colletotrichum tanaceti]